ncbi:hypothetical protein HMPREF1531_02206 [Propionibacterium sp. oral taxon 192 str. F0372]|uniref:DUF368 domain-containing protein n=1 Tax=Propionibacterium sp. oral taxon 192 TaxID=671222 RepID=UPI000354960B|nr:DUF368 domain-containing protein [Propionibacterium sp. oral taxon 192]EPH02890.1 hypothetical protein HMPREF1531_02206 [Propionibacterium sp. oral taxon 192 str. F0372]
MIESTPNPTLTTTSYLDEPESIGAWFIRLLKGILVGIGFILPGLSGGVLAVIFRIYDPIIRFLAKPFHRFGRNVMYFIPIAIGMGIGVLLFSIVVEAAFGRFSAQFICLFIGFVVGTFPSLFRQAGKQGRTIVHWILMGIAAVVIFIIMVAGNSLALNVSPNILVWVMSGALIGLGVIVPGMSPSNFLIYFGLYDKMASGIAALDLTVIIPLVIGLFACVLLLAKGAAWAFDNYYGGMYHFILGMVVGSSLAIFPAVVFPSFNTEGLAAQGLSMGPAVAFAIALFVVGTLASWAFSRLEDRVSVQREALEASVHS